MKEQCQMIWGLDEPKRCKNKNNTSLVEVRLSTSAERKIFMCRKCQVKYFGSVQVQPCGHPLSAIVYNGTTAYCGQCADESLRENINKGIEA